MLLLQGKSVELMIKAQCFCAHNQGVLWQTREEGAQRKSKAGLMQVHKI